MATLPGVGNSWYSSAALRSSARFSSWVDIEVTRDEAGRGDDCRWGASRGHALKAAGNAYCAWRAQSDTSSSMTADLSAAAAEPAARPRRARRVLLWSALVALLVVAQTLLVIL